MAVRSYTVDFPIDGRGGVVPGVHIVTWTGLLNTDTGAPYVAPDKSEKSVQVFGTFGVGGNLRMEGANAQAYTSSPSGATAASPTYATLTDPTQTAINMAAAGVKEILENTTAVRPNITAGDGSTNLTVVMTVRSAKLKV
jgi:hypothetical protein